MSKDPTSSNLDDVFNSAVQPSNAGVEVENKSDDDDGDWGGFETYEDPNDVQFPTLD